MRSQWLMYALVVVVSVAAGVAIAGTPNTVGTAPTISAPSTTEAPVVTAAPDTTIAPTTTVAEDPPADTTTTTAEPATTTTTVPAPDPAEIVVVAVNGAGTQGLASEVRDQLVFFGFTQARATDGTTIVDDTAVYYFEGFEREAAAIAEFLELDPESILPVVDAPSFGVLDGDQVAVYIGRDRS